MDNSENEGADLLVLENVLRYCKNWFCRDIVDGTWIVDDGSGEIGLYDEGEDALYDSNGLLLVGQSNTTSLPMLIDGQYFRITGSIFNDALYRVSPDGLRKIIGYSLTTERWEGAIWALAVPPAVIALAKEISDWQTKFGDAVNSPFNSESFSGYSYTKASSVTQDGGPGGWEAVFRAKLNRWRKL